MGIYTMFVFPYVCLYDYCMYVVVPFELGWLIELGPKSCRVGRAMAMARGEKGENLHQLGGRAVSVGNEDNIREEREKIGMEMEMGNENKNAWVQMKCRGNEAKQEARVEWVDEQVMDDGSTKNVTKRVRKRDDSHPWKEV